MFTIKSVEFQDEGILVHYESPKGTVKEPHPIPNVQLDRAGRQGPDRALMDAIQSKLASVIFR